MKLYYSASACSLSPHIVLRELNLPFTLVRVDLANKVTEAGEDFTAINPNGYVPALQLDDGQVLTEGPAITQYLVDKYAPGSLAPLSGTVEQAQLNSHLNFIATELHKGFSPLFNPAISPEARESGIALLHKRLGLVEQLLADGREYLAGSDFTLADAYLFVVQAWAPMTGVDLSAFPHLRAFASRVSARPAVKAAMDAEKAGE